MIMLSIFMGFFNFYFCSQENLQSQFSSWKDNLWIHTIRQLRTVSVSFHSFDEKFSESGTLNL